MRKFNGFAALILCALPLLWVSCEDLVPSEDLTAPVVMQGTSSNATRTTILLTGSFQGISNKGVKEIGVKYSTSTEFPVDQTTDVKVETEYSNSMTIALENLKPDTEYYYYWYVSSGNTTVKSITNMFRTESTSAPLFREVVVDSVDENIITVKTSISEIGNACLLECGFEYREKVDGAKFMPMEFDGLPTNDSLGYALTLTDLKSDTEYEIRPYAKNAADENGTNGTIEGYGDIITGKTLDKVSPVVETKTVINIGIANATLVGTITSNPTAESDIVEKGFCLSKVNVNPTVYDSTVVVTSPTELNKDYLYELTNLEYNTTYYIRAYAKNIVEGSERVGYGTGVQFTTSQMISPEVEMGYRDETNDVNFGIEVTSSSAKCYGTLRNLELSVLKERGFIWSRDNYNIQLDEAIENGTIVRSEGQNTMFMATIDNLTPNTNYYIRAYAVYESGNIRNIGYSQYNEIYTSSKSFTEFRNILIDEEASTPTSIAVSSGIIEPGDGEITEYGFIWHSNYDLTLENNLGIRVIENENYDFFNTVIDNLKPENNYYIRAYAKVMFQGNEEVHYSDWTSHYMRPVNTPNFHELVVDYDSVTISTIPVSVAIEDKGDGEVVEAGFVWGESSNITTENCIGKQAVESTDYTNFGMKITGLQYSTYYVVKAYMTMEYNGQVNTYYSPDRSIRTQDLPYIRFYNVNFESSYNSIAMSTGVEVPEGLEILEKGFLWNNSETVYPTPENHEGKSIVTDGTLESFGDTITGLKPSNPYSFVTYLKYKYYDQEFVKTSSISSLYTNQLEGPEFSYLSTRDVKMSSVTVNGTIIDKGIGKIKERGFVWKMNDSSPTLDYCDGHVAVDLSQANMETTIEGLAPGNNYYFRMYTITEYDGVDYTHHGGYDNCYTRDLEYNLRNINLRSTTAELTVYADSTILPKSYEEIGVLYTEDDNQSFEEIENKVPVTLSANSDFTVTLNNLKMSTTYYWGMYIKLNGVYYHFINSNFKTNKKPEIGDVESPGVSN